MEDTELKLTPFGKLATKAMENFGKKKEPIKGGIVLGMLDLVRLVEIMKKQGSEEPTDLAIRKKLEDEIQRRDKN